MLYRTLVFGLLLSVLAAAGCASDRAPVRQAAPEYSGILAATEFVAGQNRFPFGLIDIDGAELTEASVQVQFYSLNQEEPEFRVEAAAQWREVTGVTPHVHDNGQTHLHVEVRGLYVVDAVTLDDPGFWGAAFTVRSSDGTRPEVEGLAFQVVAESPVPNMGDPAPPTKNLTIRDVASFADISTRASEDRMHEYSVAQALERREPFVVLFATPAFCISSMCGPVADMVAAVHDRYRDRVPFIHIEPYDLTVARTEGRLVPVDAMQEWNLQTEPWLFVVGGDGKVATRFEGLVSTEELEQALLRVLATAQMAAP